MSEYEVDEKALTSLLGGPMGSGAQVMPPSSTLVFGRLSQDDAPSPGPRPREVGEPVPHAD